MTRYELADALMYISELLQRLRQDESQLGSHELDEIDSAQSALEEVALNIKAEEHLDDVARLWNYYL